MNDFLNFLNTARQTPNLAIALLGYFALLGTLSTALVVVARIGRKQDFIHWYKTRTYASQIILPEPQARRLYQLYLKNKSIILQRLASEVQA